MLEGGKVTLCQCLSTTKKKEEGRLRRGGKKGEQWRPGRKTPEEEEAIFFIHALRVRGWCRDNVTHS